MSSRVNTDTRVLSLQSLPQGNKSGGASLGLQSIIFQIKCSRNSFQSIYSINNSSWNQVNSFDKDIKKIERFFLKTTVSDFQIRACLQVVYSHECKFPGGLRVVQGFNIIIWNDLVRCSDAIIAFNLSDARRKCDNISCEITHYAMRSLRLRQVRTQICFVTVIRRPSYQSIDNGLRQTRPIALGDSDVQIRFSLFRLDN